MYKIILMSVAPQVLSLSRRWSVIVERTQVPPVLVTNRMVATPTVLVLVHAATPRVVLFVPRRPELLPYSCVRPLHADFGLLGQGQVGPEIGLHGLGSNIVLFLLNHSLVGQPVHGRSDFLLAGSRVVKNIPESSHNYSSLSLFLNSASL